ncbi:MAG: hypothetical protein JWM16_6489 [Verrucomicrobiales bacterium]|nr:hypothetical protein [Verrucomicrobiales bacterium]
MNDNFKVKRAMEAFMTAEMFEIGMGSVAVSRFKTNGAVETGIFLVDTYCLGIKNAEFLKLDLEEYETEVLPMVAAGGPLERIETACARKLVEQAAAYAHKLGFSPYPDYKKACRVFGGISAEACPPNFVFGLDGKPFFVPGPYDTAEEIHLVLTVLESKCGPGNYEFDLLPLLPARDGETWKQD